MDSKLTSSNPPVKQSLDVRIAAQRVSCEKLAQVFGVPVTWIRSHTRARSKDVVPHFKLGRYVVFDLSDPALWNWFDSHKNNGSK
jgi:hypothetical protein